MDYLFLLRERMFFRCPILVLLLLRLPACSMRRLGWQTHYVLLVVQVVVSAGSILVALLWQLYMSVVDQQVQTVAESNFVEEVSEVED